MYQAIHRIELVVNSQRIVIDPGTILDSIDNAEALLQQGAIREYQVPELAVVPTAVPQAAQEKAEKKPKKPAKTEEVTPDFG